MQTNASPGAALFQSRLAQHLAFWGLSFFILSRHFAYEQEVRLSDLIYTFLFHLSLWPTVYLNLLILIPRLLQARRFGLYALGVSALLAAGTYFNILTFNYLADWLFPGYYFISYFKALEIAQYHIIYLAATTLLKLSKGWFLAQQQQRHISRLEKEKAEAELRALKAQVDPHFLFNTLNNLYSFALEGSAKVPEAILKLAGCMRYMLYDCNGQSVELEKELEYIKNYIELQRMRLGKDQEIKLEIEGPSAGVEAPPLLFIPFVENAFKHGLKGDGQPAYAHIRFRIGESGIFFNIENDTAPPDKHLPRKGKGIGLENVKKRLQMLYPDRHDLIIYHDEKAFSATLNINLSDR